MSFPSHAPAVCAAFLAALCLCTIAGAAEPPPESAINVLIGAIPNGVMTVTPKGVKVGIPEGDKVVDHWIVKSDDERPEGHWNFKPDGVPPHYASVAELTFENVTTTFEIGAVILLSASTGNPVQVTQSELTFSWSGTSLSGFLANYGGFAGINQDALDVFLNESTLVFSIANDIGEIWDMGGYNFNMGDGGATFRVETGTVAVRRIDDMIGTLGGGGALRSSGTLVKEGAGTLHIGGSSNDKSGLDAGGMVWVKEGTLVLTGDSPGSAKSHRAGNMLVENEATLEINAAATLVLTNNHNAIPGTALAKITIEKEAILDLAAGSTLKLTGGGSSNDDIYIAEKGILRIASEEFTTDKNRFSLRVDGGTVEVYGDVEKRTLDIGIGSSGGVIDVAKGITFESGAILGNREGDYMKTGAGTHDIVGIDLDGNVVVTEGTVILQATNRFSPTGIQNVHRIFIEGKDAVLDLTSGAVLRLTHDEEIDVVVASGGTLRANAEPFVHDRGETTVLLDGGTVEFYQGNGVNTTGKTPHLVIGAGGGTIFVADEVTYLGGTVTSENNGENNGDVVKTGTGTHVVGDIHLGNGTYHVKQGTVEFSGNIVVGSLKGNGGTTIDMTSNAATDLAFAHFEIAGLYRGGGRDLAIGNGKVAGTMTEVGKLTVTGSFDLGGSGHLVETFSVNAAATFDLKAGTMLQLTNSSSDDDIELRGKLRMASAEGTGIVKKSPAGALAGTPVNLQMDGGTIEMYLPTDVADGGVTDTLFADNINIALGSGGGTFIIPTGLTFIGGPINGDDKGHYWKLGPGTHLVQGLVIDGSLLVVAGTTILHAGKDAVQRAANVVIDNGARFELAHGVTLKLTTAMTIKSGGVVSNDGRMTMETLDLAGGTLQVPTMPTELLGGVAAPATVSTKKLIVGNNARILVGDALCQLGTYTFENVLEVTGSEGITDTHLHTLNSSQMALSRAHWGRTTAASGDTLNLTVQFISVQEYVDEIGWTKGNATAVAGLIDDHVGDRYLEDPAMALASFSTASVNEIRHQLEALTPAGLDAELRAAMAGELIGDAARMVTGSHYYRMIFQHLDSIPTGSPPRTGKTSKRSSLMRGQAKVLRSTLRLWFNPYAQSEKGEGDPQTFDGYTMTRAGFLLGGDRHLTKQVIAGVVFHYGSPNVKNDLGKVSAHDFVLGAYMKVPIYWQITANAMVGYGMQNYTYQGTGGKSKFDGNILFGSLEFARPYPAMQVLNFTPFVGVDFQNIDMDDLTVNLPTLGGMSVSPGGLDSVMLRVGLRGEWMRLRTRIQYIRQLSGDDHVMSTVAFHNVSTTVRSVQWGKDWVNVGVGGEMIQTRNFRLFADYDLDVSKKTTSHLGSLSAVVMW